MADETVLARNRVEVRVDGMDQVDKDLDNVGDRMTQLVRQMEDQTKRIERMLAERMTFAPMVEQTERELSRMENLFRERDRASARYDPVQRVPDSMARAIAPQLAPHSQQSSGALQVYAQTVNVTAAALSGNGNVSGLVPNVEASAANRDEFFGLGIERNQRDPMAKAVSQFESATRKTGRAFEGFGVTLGGVIASSRKAQAQMERMERIERLRAGAAEYAARFGQVAGQFGTAGVAMGTAAVFKGYQGTVEGERFAREMDLISREMAGAFKPVMDTVTGLAQKLRHGLEGLNPQQQDRLAAGGMLAAGGAGLARFGGMGFLRGLGMAYPVVKGLDLAANAVPEVVDLWQGREDRAAGRIGARDAKRLGLTDIANIKDPIQRQAAIEEKRREAAQRQEQLYQSMGVDRNRRGLAGAAQNAFGYLTSTGLGQMVKSELGNLFGVQVAGPRGAGFGGVARGVKDLEMIQGGLNAMQRDPNWKPGQDADPDRRRVMYSQASYEAAGSTREALQLELLKSGANEEQAKEPVMVALDELIKALWARENRELAKEGKPPLPGPDDLQPMQAKE